MIVLLNFVILLLMFEYNETKFAIKALCFMEPKGYYFIFLEELL